MLCSDHVDHVHDQYFPAHKWAAFQYYSSPTHTHAQAFMCTVHAVIVSHTNLCPLTPWLKSTPLLAVTKSWLWERNSAARLLTTSYRMIETPHNDYWTREHSSHEVIGARHLGSHLKWASRAKATYRSMDSSSPCTSNGASSRLHDSQLVNSWTQWSQ